MDNLEQGIRRFSVGTEKDGVLNLLRPLPINNDPWGVLTTIKGTSWEREISIISGESLSHALHGHVMPLWRELGRSPEASMKHLPVQDRICKLRNECLLYDEKKCFPCKRLPECYDPPGLETLESRMAARIMALAWAEGRYVIVVVGPEFSLI